jgi:hypothetical protein
MILGLLSCQLRNCPTHLEEIDTLLPRVLFIIFNTLAKGEEADSIFAASVFGGIYCRRGRKVLEESLWIPFLEEVLSDKFTQSHLSLNLGELTFFFLISLKESNQTRLLQVVESFQTRKIPPQLCRILVKVT